ncbi:ribonuclease H-like domain-containing protein [Globomyces pollinis-pini]|nr:ribonuclease H-like domain-containing protein [Globomyces pollinis-pini]
MEVTSDNFTALLPKIISDIQAADFVAIDLEFTGLGSAKETQSDMLDDIQERYRKLSQIAGHYLPVQVGVCVFKFIEAKPGCAAFYEARPYNFYVIPKLGSSSSAKMFGLDKTFGIQLGSLHFLSQNNFDMAKWATKGIPFVNHEDEERIRLKIDKVDMDVPPQEGDMLFEFMTKSIILAKDFIQNSTEKMFTIPTPSSYHKKIASQAIIREFNGALGIKLTRQNIEVRKLSDEEREEEMANRRGELMRAELDELVGFRKVLDALSTAAVPVVGHNMYLDICYTFEHFFRKLPEDAKEFKNQLHSFLPIVFDTKYIAESSSSIQKHVKSTVLEKLYETVLTDQFKYPNITFGVDFKAYVENDSCHEAAYDAYSTGVCFLRMLSFNEGFKTTTKIDFKSEKSLQFENRLHLSYCYISFMHLDGNDDEPDYSSVYRMYNFPINWKTADVQNVLLKDVGQTRVKWIDDTSCIITVQDSKKLDNATQLCLKTTRKKMDFKLEKYEPNQDKGEVDITPPKEQVDEKLVEEALLEEPVTVKRSTSVKENSKKKKSKTE